MYRVENCTKKAGKKSHKKLLSLNERSLFFGCCKTAQNPVEFRRMFLYTASMSCNSLVYCPSIIKQMTLNCFGCISNLDRTLRQAEMSIVKIGLLLNFKQAVKMYNCASSLKLKPFVLTKQIYADVILCVFQSTFQSDNKVMAIDGGVLESNQIFIILSCVLVCLGVKLMRSNRPQAKYHFQWNLNPLLINFFNPKLSLESKLSRRNQFQQEKIDQKV